MPVRPGDMPAQHCLLDGALVDEARRRRRGGGRRRGPVGPDDAACEHSHRYSSTMSGATWASRRSASSNRTCLRSSRHAAAACSNVGSGTSMPRKEGAAAAPPSAVRSSPVYSVTIRCSSSGRLEDPPVVHVRHGFSAVVYENMPRRLSERATSRRLRTQTTTLSSGTRSFQRASGRACARILQPHGSLPPSSATSVSASARRGEGGRRRPTAAGAPEGCPSHPRTRRAATRSGGGSRRAPVPSALSAAAA